MAYTSDQLPSGLDAITTIDASDVLVVGDNSDSGRVKKITIENFETEQDARTTALTNKTIDGDLNTLQDIGTASLKTRTGADASVVTGTAGTSGDLAIWNVDGDIVDGPTPPTGTIVGHTDTQTLTNKDISSSTNTYRAASSTETGAVELATVEELETGTDTTRAIVPDILADSNFGEAVIGILVSDPNGDAITTGDGKAVARIPSKITGMNLVEVAASVSTVSSSGAVTVMVRRSRRSSATARTNADMLSTAITLDQSEFDTVDAATAAVINGSNDDVITGDYVFVDIDGAGTGVKGLYVELTFRLP